MNREPINPDDPQLTAYALGELAPHEMAEFEAQLRISPTAQKELESMIDMMSLLSEGLSAEWKSEVEGPSLAVVKPDNVIAPVAFSRHRRVAVGLGIAAAAAALAVGGFMVTGALNEAEAPAVAKKKNDPRHSPVMVADMSSLLGPKLFLEDEIDDVSSLDLVNSDDNEAIDASYLDADTKVGTFVPTSYSPPVHPGAGVGEAVERRVDSYLPPVPVGNVKTGMIENRLRDRLLKADEKGEIPSDRTRVVVRGYVTMGDDLPEDFNFSGVPAGFQPVAISGNPVVHGETDLRILADLNRIQQELSQVVSSMPENSADKAQLEGILKKSRRVTSELRGVFAR